MDSWKEHFGDLLNVKCVRQTGDHEEGDLREQKEEIRYVVIITGEVLKAAHMLKRSKATTHDNVTAKVLQNIEKRVFEMLTEMYNKIWEEEKIQKY